MAGEDIEIGIEVLDVDGHMHRCLAAIDQHRDAAGMRQSRTTSLIGTMVPSAFDIWVMATILVRGPSSFSNSSIRKLPSSSIGPI